MAVRRTLPLLLLALSLPRPVHADGLPIEPAPGEAESRPHVMPDGRGGALVTFKTASLKVGAVHLGSGGTPDGGIGFAPAVVPFTIETSEPVRLSLPSDTQVVLVSDRSTSTSAVLTSLRAGGAALPGFPVGLAMAHRYPAVVPGLAGRTLLVSKNSDATSFWTLRAAIIGANGQVQSSVQLPSPVQFFNADRLDATTDGAGGLIAVFPYYDMTASGSKDLAVFRYTAAGARPWGDVPRPIVFANGDQTDPHVVDDGTGGALLVWTDPRVPAHGSDIYALHIDAGAQRVPGWDFYGQPLCDALGEQDQPRLTRDGSGGAWVVWRDRRADSTGDLRYTHVLADGALAPGFTHSGTELCTAPNAQGDVDLAGDGAGGFFAVWRDDRSGTSDIYAQHVLATGALSPGWAVNGRALTTAAGVQDQPSIAAVGTGRVIAAWRDARSAPARTYALAVVDAATTGAPRPAATMLRLAAVDPARAGEVRLRVSVPAAGTASLELVDVSGRRLERRQLTGPLAGEVVALHPPVALPPGLYFARLSQGGASALARVTLLR